ncbi:hypothetical protein HHI36_001337 [Cryptolaemus montrouzieri]|uniref:FP protein C-terminal domain-containing protein n=1 Tax=Cryptolaemus montrouzieri TaxID=559131 RepID=A0ABD2P7X3_9CUCU
MPERNILVKFSTRIKRDSFYSASRLLKSEQKNRNGASAVDGVTDSLYVNEHLAANNKYLFRSPRETARELKYKFVWTKNCIIYVRKDDTSKSIPVKNEDDIRKM